MLDCPPSSPPRLLPGFAPNKQKFEIFHDAAHALPSPLPTSEREVASSPSSEASEAVFPVTRSVLKQLRTIKLRPDVPILVGRSSRACEFALETKSKLVSRIHARCCYESATELITIECLGWNGLTMIVPTTKGPKEYPVVRDQTIYIERIKGVELSIQNTRTFIEVSTGESETTEDEGDLLAVAPVAPVASAAPVAAAVAATAYPDAAAAPPPTQLDSQHKNIIEKTLKLLKAAAPIGLASPAPLAPQAEPEEKENGQAKKRVHFELDKVGLSRPKVSTLAEYRQRRLSMEAAKRAEVAEQAPADVEMTVEAEVETKPAELESAVEGANEAAKAELAVEAAAQVAEPEAAQAELAVEAELAVAPKVSEPETAKAELAVAPKVSEHEAAEAELAVEAAPQVSEPEAAEAELTVETAPKVAEPAKAELEVETTPKVAEPAVAELEVEVAPKVAEPAKAELEVEVAPKVAEPKAAETAPTIDTPIEPETAPAEPVPPITPAPTALALHTKPTNKKRKAPETKKAAKKARISAPQETIERLATNCVAFSRLNSTPLSHILSSSHEFEGVEPAAVSAILGGASCIGVIQREGKDALGKPLEPEYYYISEMDSDTQRKQMVLQSKGGKSLRACRRVHKQYFYKRPK